MELPPIVPHSYLRGDNKIYLEKDQSLASCSIGCSILVENAEIKVPEYKHELRIPNPENPMARYTWIFWRRTGILPDGSVTQVWERIE